jgi:mannose-6-phosphate isomerase-like protein (cupin superfamily)
MPDIQPMIIATAQAPQDGWDDPAKGKLSWHTLFSGGMTTTHALTCGVAMLQPGEFLLPHRHPPAEIYFVLAGQGIMHLDGKESPIKMDDAVFIPGNMIHGIRNEGPEMLRFLYVFPTDGFDDVTYDFAV